MFSLYIHRPTFALQMQDSWMSVCVQLLYVWKYVCLFIFLFQCQMEAWNLQIQCLLSFMHLHSKYQCDPIKRKELSFNLLFSKSHPLSAHFLSNPSTMAVLCWMLCLSLWHCKSLAFQSGKNNSLPFQGLGMHCIVEY